MATVEQIDAEIARRKRLTEIDALIAAKQAQPQGEVQNAISIPEQVIGGVSGAATLASDIAGTAAGGLTALVDVLNPFTDNDPVQLIEQVKSKLRIDPTQGGEAALNQLGAVVESSGMGGILDSVKKFQIRQASKG